MKLIKVGSQYVNPEHVMAVIDQGSETEIVFTQNLSFLTQSTSLYTEEPFHKVAHKLADEVVQ